MGQGKILIVLAGAPGCGKSTFADEIAGTYGFDIVSTDAIRQEVLGDAADQDKGWLVFDIAYERLRGFLGNGYSPGTIFDATNCRRRARRDVLREAEGCYDVAICAVAEEGLGTCLRRNAQRDRVVPDEVVEKMYDNLQSCYPDTDEGFDYVVGFSELDGLLMALVQ